MLYTSGLDLNGNTFWEFRDATGVGVGRWRRIMEQPKSVHYGDVRVSPQWHQWLRYTRQDPPTLEEQRQDVVRQSQMKMLAAEADARWAAKPSLIDAPGQEQGQPRPALETESRKTSATQRGRTAISAGPEKGFQEEKREDPFRHPRGGPSEDWRPKAWSPPTTQR